MNEAAPPAAEAGDRPHRPWALRLEYDGSPFVGWQRQVVGISVQSVLEEAAARLDDGRPVASEVAGRTDAGVHAEGQVALIRLPDRPAGAWRPERLRDALNFHLLPHPVAVLEAAEADPGWSPRFSATSRQYRYLILNRRTRPALERARVWHVERRLDLDAMRAAAACLFGRHDFTSFRAAACQANSPVRTLDRLEITRNADHVVIEAQARSFLHHQVRNMVGTLTLVGTGAWPAARVATALEARDRAAAGPTAPACGLRLTGVDYDPSPFATTRDV